MGAPVLAKARQLAVALIALVGRLRLIESDEVNEVTRRFGVEATGFREARRHLRAQAARAVDHQLEVVR